MPTTRSFCKGRRETHSRPSPTFAHCDRLPATEQTGYQTGSDSLPDTDFDEPVVGQRLHVEWMDADRWWMRIGDVVVWITVDPSGHARQVEVHTPHDP